MTSLRAAAPDSQADDVRWRAWQARGAEADRRSAIRVRAVAVLIAIGLTVWLFVELM